MNKTHIGIIGSTGLVGQQLVKLLSDNNYVNLKLSASSRLTDVYIEPFEKKEEYTITYAKLDEHFFDDLQIIFFCATNEITEKWWKFAYDKNIYMIY